MKISLLHKPNKDNKKESPLFVRVRGKTSNGIFSSSLISTGINILPKNFSSGVIKTSTQNYTHKQKIVNTILNNLEQIISDIKENGLEPNPQLVKKEYENKLKEREFTTPVPKSFWKAFEEWKNSKRGKSRGYTKTIITLQNRLIDFQSYNKSIITFDFIVGRTIIFQSEFENFLMDSRELSNNYVNKLYGNLSSFLYFSYQLGYIQRKPKLKLLSQLVVDEKVYLRTEEVIKLFNSTKWDFEEGKDFSKNPHIYLIEQKLEGKNSIKYGETLKITNWEYVKWVHLWCCSIGCRISDVPHFKVNDFTFDRKTQIISWIQQKTDKVNNVPLNDVSGFIFQKFSSGKSLSQNLFPSLSTQKFNKHLKLLLKDLRFNRLVSKPKKVGSKIIDTEEKPLWSLISSHSGRRSFTKNLIDLGTMDYQTIMKLSSHKTFSQFSKYISVITEDVMKSRKLYSMNSDKSESYQNQLLSEFNKLSEDNKKIILGLTRSLNK